MARTSKATTLAAMLADDTTTVTVKTVARDPIIADMAAEHGVTLPKTVTVSKKNTIKTAPTTVKTTTTIPVADGYSIVVVDGEHNVEEIKAAIVRNTANPMYAVALLLAARKCATFKIVRNENVKGTPMARITAAMVRGQKIRMDAILRGVKIPTEVAYFHKLGVSQHATEKNTWMFVKTA